MRTLAITCLICFISLTPLRAETYVSGFISGVWGIEGSPYIVTADVYVPLDSTLQIMPGCSVIFEGHYEFTVDSNAVLRAKGTTSEPIVFTALDTNLTTIDGGHHGIRLLYVAEGCTLSHCLIQYGNATDGDDEFNTEEDYGGAILCWYSSPVISHNNISGNRALWGGGIFCYNSYPQIESNSITGNYATWSGGGIWCNLSSPIIEGNLIEGNTADSLAGGIGCWISNPEISGNEISENRSGLGGGGIYCYSSGSAIAYNLISRNEASWGGGIAISLYSYPDMYGNQILNNNSVYGAGIYCYFNSANIVNNLIKGNESSHSGAGILCNGSLPRIVNSTVINNSADSLGGGLYCLDGSKPMILNSIFWENTADIGNEIFTHYFTMGACSIFIAYSNINPMECLIGGDLSGFFFWGPGNLNIDPLFEDALCHLASASGCIDQGAEYGASPWRDTVWAPFEDFEGDPRPSALGWDMGWDERYDDHISEQSGAVPQDYSITVFPNPFNSRCNITISGNWIEYNQPLWVKIYDLRGKLVLCRDVACNVSTAGKDEGGYSQEVPPLVRGVRGDFLWQPEPSLSSGIYFIKIQTGSKYLTEKIIYMK